MNCENMTDAQINEAVTAIENNCASWDFNGTEFYHCGINGSEYHSIPVMDYCNSPADAWPIIIKMSEDSVFRFSCEALICEAGDSNDLDDDIFIFNDNTLKSFMIAYLILKDK